MGVQVVASQQARDHMVDGNQPGLPNMTFDGRATPASWAASAWSCISSAAPTPAATWWCSSRRSACWRPATCSRWAPTRRSSWTIPGGGSAKEWPSTVDGVLRLDFDTVVPGHGTVVDKAAMRTFRGTAERLKNRVHEMIVKKASRDDITKMLKAEFSYADFHINASLDGLLVELR